MGFLIETVIEGVVDTVGELIARRFGLLGCLLPIAAILLVIALIVWAS
jgi:hypothetical protein